MDCAMYITLRFGFGLSLTMIPIWPLLTLPQDPFSKSYFTFYVALMFLWGHGAMCITTLIPIYEFMYPEKEEEVPAPSEEVKVAPVAFTGEQEQVMGFYQPAAGAGAAVPMAPAPQPAAVDYSQVGSA